MQKHYNGEESRDRREQAAGGTLVHAEYPVSEPDYVDEASRENPGDSRLERQARVVNPYRLFPGAFIPNWLLQRNEISAGAKLAYARLCQYANKVNGEAWPGRAALARKVAVSERTLDRYLDELKKYKLIQVELRGLTRTNVYRFLYSPWMTESELSDLSSQNSTQTTTLDLSNLSSLESSNLSNKKNHRKESLKRHITSDRFRRFYDTYPRQVARPAAENEFNRINPDDVTFARMLKGLEVWKNSDQWRRSREFIPYPATWLNQRRWEDEILTPMAQFQYEYREAPL